MAMPMQEMFYGKTEMAYFDHYGRQTAVPYSQYCYQTPPPTQMSTFDLMVPMCCTRCEDQVQDALLVLGSIRDVVCDAPQQRVIVTGCVDPAQALKQVRRVNRGATFWSTCSYSTERYEVFMHQEPRRHIQQDTNSRLSQRSHPGQYHNRSSSDGYARSLCPAYRDSTETHYINVNPTIATRVEMEY